MSATIRFFGVEATIKGRKWNCSDKTVEGILNASVNADTPTGYCPDPDYYIAQRVVERLGAEFVRNEAPESEPGRVY